MMWGIVRAWKETKLTPPSWSSQETRNGVWAPVFCGQEEEEVHRLLPACLRQGPKKAVAAHDVRPKTRKTRRHPEQLCPRDHESNSQRAKRSCFDLGHVWAINLVWRRFCFRFKGFDWIWYDSELKMLKMLKMLKFWKLWTSLASLNWVPLQELQWLLPLPPSGSAAKDLRSSWGMASARQSCHSRVTAVSLVSSCLILSHLISSYLILSLQDTACIYIYIWLYVVAVCTAVSKKFPVLAMGYVEVQ